jgi:hypothetical protein
VTHARRRRSDVRRTKGELDAQPAPAHLPSHAGLLALQRSAGNRAVAQLLQRTWRVDDQREATYWETDAYSAKMPLYQPFGYKLVGADQDPTHTWRKVEEPTPGLNVIHWPFDAGQLNEVEKGRMDQGPSFASYLKVNDRIRTTYEGDARITAIETGAYHSKVPNQRDKLVLDKSLSKDGKSYSAKGGDGGTWAYVRPEKPPGRTGPAGNVKGPKDQPPTSIALGFLDLYVKQGGGQERKISPDDQGGFTKLPTLAMFAEATQSLAYWDWGDYAPENPLFPLRGKSLIAKITAVMRVANEIHFNLDGFIGTARTNIDDVTTLLERFRSEQSTLHTAGELAVVLGDNGLLAKTQFYRKGERLKNERREKYTKL